MKRFIRRVVDVDVDKDERKETRIIADGGHTEGCLKQLMTVCAPRVAYLHLENEDDHEDEHMDGNKHKSRTDWIDGVNGI